MIDNEHNDIHIDFAMEDDYDYNDDNLNVSPKNDDNKIWKGKMKRVIMRHNDDSYNDHSIYTEWQKSLHVLTEWVNEWARKSVQKGNHTTHHEY